MQENAIKANETAMTLYPHEKWEVLETRISPMDRDRTCAKKIRVLRPGGCPGKVGYTEMPPII